MKACVTGGAGFIGSHLVDALVGEGDEVVVIDNLSSGRLENVNRAASFILGDLREWCSGWVESLRGVDVVFHFAADPEVRASMLDPRSHVEGGVVATLNVLEACRRLDVPHLVFASSSTVYGEAREVPTPEDYHPLEPISVYGACKLACENIVAAYSRLYGVRGLILRYANIVGPRSSRGVIVDFIEKLRRSPRALEILGDGGQRKSYLHVSDAVEATLRAFKAFIHDRKPYDVYNVGNEDWVTVREVADIVVEEMGLEGVEYVFKPATEDGRGWPGDVKYMLLDISKLRSIGWRPRWSSREAVRKAVRQLLGREC